MASQNNFFTFLMYFLILLVTKTKLIVFSDALPARPAYILSFPSNVRDKARYFFWRSTLWKSFRERGMRGRFSSRALLMDDLSFTNGIRAAACLEILEK